MTTLWITPSTGPGTVSHTAAAADTSVSVASVTPTNNWTLYLRVLSFTAGTNGVNRARLAFEDSVNAFTASLAGPVRCIVPVNNVPEGRMYSTRWRDFDDLRIGTSSAVLRTNLYSISGGGAATIVYQAWLTY